MKSKMERWATQQAGWIGGEWMPGDFNGDGFMDLAVAFNDNGYASIDVHLGNGSSFYTFQRWATQQGGWPGDVRWLAGDFNGDGVADLSMGFNDSDENSIDVHPSNRTAIPTFQRWASLQGGWMSDGRWVAADFDGDGHTDIAIAFDDGDHTSIDVHKMGKFAQPCVPMGMSHMQTYVDESTMDDTIDTEEMQGIAQSSQNWYWNSRLRIYRVPTTNRIDGPADLAWQIAAPPSPGQGVFCQLGYNHMGDSDFYNGNLYVTLSRDESHGHGDECPLPAGVTVTDPALLVLDANLSPVGFGIMRGASGSWVAVNPVDGRLYNAKPGFGTLRAYDLKTVGAVPKGIDTPEARHSLDYIGRVDLPLGFSGDYWDQGGAFSPNGTFYYVADTGTVDSGNDSSIQSGVHAFKLTPFPAGTTAISPDAPEPADHVISTAPGVEKVFVGGDTNTGYFRIAYDPQYSFFGDWIGRQYELEGTTVYRGTDGLMHVMVVMLHNESGEDDISLYGWYNNEP